MILYRQKERIRSADSLVEYFWFTFDLLLGDPDIVECARVSGGNYSVIFAAFLCNSKSMDTVCRERISPKE